MKGFRAYYDLLKNPLYEGNLRIINLVFLLGGGS